MSDKPLYVGFDLGTTNSAAAVFDGDQTVVVRNSQGETLTPSVVRIDARERVTVGSKARRYLERDPENTHHEFKRLMGTGKQLEFPAAKLSKRPEELAALILASLRQDVEDQLGVAPVQAVISVPALFELPQSSATSEAAKLAGFERVELLQEPIASALAAGWSNDEAGAWLVYDLGGGTFDASLLETADGFLRVVGHDGDNFLGGRDFDWALVDWALQQIREREGVQISRGDPSHGLAIRLLKQAAEEVKIELSRSHDAVLVPASPLIVGSDELEIELEINRTKLETLCAGLVERSVEVCRRLLRQNRIEPGELGRIVFVGGPTAMPSLRDRVGALLGAPIAEGHDPMTLVAQGAAIYAATANLDARPKTGKSMAKIRGRRLWLQFPAVSSDTSPHVVGRVVDGEGPRPVRLELHRGDGLWQSPPTAVDGEGGFVIGVELLPRKANVFRLQARDAEGNPVPVDPPTITIVQGMTISDPPLSRTIGVALANDTVRVYFERGTPLPAKRTFTHHTVESVAKGAEGSVVKIPIVQGEYDRAHLCRLVGTLEIPARDIRASLPSNSEVELTLELDRGGRLSARALVSGIDQVFEEVAHLLVPAADPDVLRATIEATQARLIQLRGDAFRQGTPQVLGVLDRVEQALLEVERDLEAARGGNEDAGQRARRSLLEIDADLETVEQTKRWPELEERRIRTMAWAASVLSQHGTPREQKLFEEVSAAVDRASGEKDPRELQRQLRLARQLGETAWFRDPDTWEYLFNDAVSQSSQATDLPLAQSLIREGRQALERKDSAALRRVVERLWRLLPSDVQTRRQSFDSGVR